MEKKKCSRSLPQHIPGQSNIIELSKDCFGYLSINDIMRSVFATKYKSIEESRVCNIPYYQGNESETKLKNNRKEDNPEEENDELNKKLCLDKEGFYGAVKDTDETRSRKCSKEVKSVPNACATELFKGCREHLLANIENNTPHFSHLQTNSSSSTAGKNETKCYYSFYEHSDPDRDYKTNLERLIAITNEEGRESAGPIYAPLITLDVSSHLPQRQNASVIDISNPHLTVSAETSFGGHGERREKKEGRYNMPHSESVLYEIPPPINVDESLTPEMHPGIQETAVASNYHIEARGEFVSGRLEEKTSDLETSLRSEDVNHWPSDDSQCVNTEARVPYEAFSTKPQKVSGVGREGGKYTEPEPFRNCVASAPLGINYDEGEIHFDTDTNDHKKRMPNTEKTEKCEDEHNNCENCPGLATLSIISSDASPTTLPKVHTDSQVRESGSTRVDPKVFKHEFSSSGQLENFLLHEPAVLSVGASHTATLTTLYPETKFTSTASQTSIHSPPVNGEESAPTKPKLLTNKKCRGCGCVLDLTENPTTYPKIYSDCDERAEEKPFHTLGETEPRSKEVVYSLCSDSPKVITSAKVLDTAQVETEYVNMHNPCDDTQPVFIPARHSHTTSGSTMTPQIDGESVKVQHKLHATATSSTSAVRYSCSLNDTWNQTSELLQRREKRDTEDEGRDIKCPGTATQMPSPPVPVNVEESPPQRIDLLTENAATSPKRTLEIYSGPNTCQKWKEGELELKGVEYQYSSDSQTAKVHDRASRTTAQIKAVESECVKALPVPDYMAERRSNKYLIVRSAGATIYGNGTCMIVIDTCVEHNGIQRSSLLNSAVGSDEDYSRDEGGISAKNATFQTAILQSPVNAIKSLTRAVETETQREACAIVCQVVRPNESREACDILISLTVENDLASNAKRELDQPCNGSQRVVIAARVPPTTSRSTITPIPSSIDMKVQGNPHITVKSSTTANGKERKRLCSKIYCPLDDNDRDNNNQKKRSELLQTREEADAEDEKRKKENSFVKCAVTATLPLLSVESPPQTLRIENPASNSRSTTTPMTSGRDVKVQHKPHTTAMCSTTTDGKQRKKSCSEVHCSRSLDDNNRDKNTCELLQRRKAADMIGTDSGSEEHNGVWTGSLLRNDRASDEDYSRDEGTISEKSPNPTSQTTVCTCPLPINTNDVNNGGERDHKKRSELQHRGQEVDEGRNKENNSVKCACIASQMPINSLPVHIDHEESPSTKIEPLIVKEHQTGDYHVAENPVTSPNKMYLDPNTSVEEKTCQNMEGKELESKDVGYRPCSDSQISITSANIFACDSRRMIEAIESESMEGQLEPSYTAERMSSNKSPIRQSSFVATICGDSLTGTDTCADRGSAKGIGVWSTSHKAEIHNRDEEKNGRSLTSQNATLSPPISANESQSLVVQLETQRETCAFLSHIVSSNKNTETDVIMLLTVENEWVANAGEIKKGCNKLYCKSTSSSRDMYNPPCNDGLPVFIAAVASHTTSSSTIASVPSRIDGESVKVQQIPHTTATPSVSPSTTTDGKEPCSEINWSLINNNRDNYGQKKGSETKACAENRSEKCMNNTGIWSSTHKRASDEDHRRDEVYKDPSPISQGDTLLPLISANKLTPAVETGTERETFAFICRVVGLNTETCDITSTVENDLLQKVCKKLDYKSMSNSMYVDIYHPPCGDTELVVIPAGVPYTTSRSITIPMRLKRDGKSLKQQHTATTSSTTADGKQRRSCSEINRSCNDNNRNEKKSELPKRREEADTEDEGRDEETNRTLKINSDSNRRVVKKTRQKLEESELESNDADYQPFNKSQTAITSAKEYGTDSGRTTAQIEAWKNECWEAQLELSNTKHPPIKHVFTAVTVSSGCMIVTCDCMIVPCGSAEKGGAKANKVWSGLLQRSETASDDDFGISNGPSTTSQSTTLSPQVSDNESLTTVKQPGALRKTCAFNCRVHVVGTESDITMSLTVYRGTKEVYQMTELRIYHELESRTVFCATFKCTPSLNGKYVEMQHKPLHTHHTTATSSTTAGGKEGNLHVCSEKNCSIDENKGDDNNQKRTQKRKEVCAGDEERNNNLWKCVGMTSQILTFPSHVNAEESPPTKLKSLHKGHWACCHHVHISPSRTYIYSSPSTRVGKKICWMLEVESKDVGYLPSSDNQTAITSAKLINRTTPQIDAVESECVEGQPKSSYTAKKKNCLISCSSTAVTMSGKGMIGTGTCLEKWSGSHETASDEDHNRDEESISKNGPSINSQTATLTPPVSAKEVLTPVIQQETHTETCAFNCPTVDSNENTETDIIMSSTVGNDLVTNARDTKKVYEKLYHKSITCPRSVVMYHPSYNDGQPVVTAARVSPKTSRSITTPILSRIDGESVKVQHRPHTTTTSSTTADGKEPCPEIQKREKADAGRGESCLESKCSPDDKNIDNRDLTFSLPANKEDYTGTSKHHNTNVIEKRWQICDNIIISSDGLIVTGKCPNSMAEDSLVKREKPGGEDQGKDKESTLSVKIVQRVESEYVERQCGPSYTRNADSSTIVDETKDQRNVNDSCKKWDSEKSSALKNSVKDHVPTSPPPHSTDISQPTLLHRGSQASASYTVDVKSDKQFNHTSQPTESKCSTTQYSESCIGYSLGAITTIVLPTSSCENNGNGNDDKPQRRSNSLPKKEETGVEGEGRKEKSRCSIPITYLPKIDSRYDVRVKENVINEGDTEFTTMSPPAQFQGWREGNYLLPRGENTHTGAEENNSETKHCLPSQAPTPIGVDASPQKLKPHIGWQPQVHREHDLWPKTVSKKNDINIGQSVREKRQSLYRGDGPPLKQEPNVPTKLYPTPFVVFSESSNDSGCVVTNSTHSMGKELNPAHATGNKIGTCTSHSLPPNESTPELSGEHGHKVPSNGTSSTQQEFVTRHTDVAWPQANSSSVTTPVELTTNRHSEFVACCSGLPDEISSGKNVLVLPHKEFPMGSNCIHQLESVDLTLTTHFPQNPELTSTWYPKPFQTLSSEDPNELCSYDSEYEDEDVLDDTDYEESVITYIPLPHLVHIPQTFNEQAAPEDEGVILDESALPCAIPSN